MQVFTHTSLKGTVKQGRSDPAKSSFAKRRLTVLFASASVPVFEEPDSTGAICDYERLEHLGDSVLGFIATELIQDLFPRVSRLFRSSRPSPSLDCDLIPIFSSVVLADGWMCE